MRHLILVCLVVAASAYSSFASNSAPSDHENYDHLVHASHQHSAPGSAGPQIDTPNSHLSVVERKPASARRTKRESSDLVAGNSGETDKRNGKSGKELIDFRSIADFLKLIFNPIELTKAIAKTFKLDFEKLSALVGKSFLFGLEAALTPVVVSIKLTEKLFVPNSCSLKFVCMMGSHLNYVKVTVLKMSSNILDGSKHVRAFTDGIIGRDCESVYSGCESNSLTLQKSVQEKAGLDEEEKTGGLMARLEGQQQQLGKYMKGIGGKGMDMLGGQAEA